MGDGLYLGRQVDLEKRQARRARLDLDPADLLTHGLIVGMTGSGKTGLAIVLIEELLRQGVPVIAIDPKGDLANLLLLFDDLDAASFEPWIDPEAARREGKDVKAAAADAAARLDEGPRRVGPRPGRRRGAAAGPRRGRLHAGLERRRAAQRPAVARRARRALRLRRGGPARRDPVDRRRACSASCASRPTRCSRRRPSSSPPSSSARWRAGKGLSLETPDRRRSPSRPSTRSARCRSRPRSRARTARAS